MLGKNNEQAAREALAAWVGQLLPSNCMYLLWNILLDGLQVGGGINDTNCKNWIDAGASKVFSAEKALLSKLTLNLGHCDIISIP